MLSKCLSWDRYSVEYERFFARSLNWNVSEQFFILDFGRLLSYLNIEVPLMSAKWSDFFSEIGLEEQLVMYICPSVTSHTLGCNHFNESCLGVTNT